jgi:hypothetical protein
MRAVTLGMATLVLLAGCSDPGGDDGDDADFSDLGLTPTAETGIIRGVVVDDAIRPVAGATIAARGPAAEASTTSTGEGLFGFEGLAPGTWFLTVEKPGFQTAQASVDVAAGVAEPPITKVLLAADPSSLPYFEAYTYDGFLECGVTSPVVGVALCLAPNSFGQNVTTDKTQITYGVTGHPRWVQTEMVWESTQAAGGELALMYSWSGDCGLLCDHEVDGVSPLLLQANQTVIDTILGNSSGFYVRVFNSDLDETDMGLDSVCTPIPDPVVGNTWCMANGVGLTLEQKFTHYTHIFYGYAPDPSWRFTSGDPVPLPPA